jgi:ankyrin repeat protein
MIILKPVIYYIAIIMGKNNIPSIILCTLLSLSAALPLSAQEGGGPVAQLYQAILNRDAAAVKRLIRGGMDPNTPLGPGRPPLVIAIEQGEPDIVRLLLDLGANVNLGIEESFGGFDGGAGRTYMLSPLYIALDRDSPEIVHILLERGADVYHEQEGRYASVLVPALKNDNLEMIELLLEHGLRRDYLYPDLLYKCLDLHRNELFKHFFARKEAEKLGFSLAGLLERAAGYDNLTIVRFLAQNGALKTKNTALHISVNEGYAAMAEYLISAGCDVNTTDKEGHVPLYYALHNNRPALAELLLKNKALVKTQNSDNNDFLFDTVVYGHRDLTLRLLESGAAVNTRNTASTLKIIIRNHDTELLKLLLKKGLKLKGLRSDGDTTFLSLALGACFLDMALILLEAGVEPDETDVNLVIGRGYIDFVRRFTAIKYPFTTAHLNTALREKQHDIALLFIEYGVELNVDGPDYADPPLANAVQQDYLDIAELLISKGALVNQLIKYYYDGSIACYTALDFAESDSMRELLIKHGAIPAVQHPDYEYVPYEAPLGEAAGE